MLIPVTREDELDYSEAFGRLFEVNGATRIAGRLVGWLLICDPPEQSQAELVELLGVSKASVSTELRRLEHNGLIERVTLPGDRRSYYRLSFDAWPELMARRLRMIEQLVELAERGIALLGEQPSLQHDRLVRMRDAYTHLQGVMQTAVEQLRRDAARNEAARPLRAARTRAGQSRLDPSPASVRAGRATRTHEAPTKTSRASKPDKRRKR